MAVTKHSPLAAVAQRLLYLVFWSRPLRMRDARSRGTCRDQFADMFSNRGVRQPVAVILQNRCFGVRKAVQVCSDRRNEVFREITGIALLHAVVIGAASNAPVGSFQLAGIEIRYQPALSQRQRLIFGDRNEPSDLPGKTAISSDRKERPSIRGEHNLV